MVCKEFTKVAALNIFPGIAGLMLILSVVACSPMDNGDEAAERSKRELEYIVEKKAGSSGDEFVIGLIPEVNIFEQKKKHQPLMDYLSEKMDVHVGSKVLRRYDGIVDAFRRDDIDAAFHGSFGFAFINELIGVQPVARPLWKNGSSSYKGYIVVRKDSGLTADVSGWKSKKMALVSKNTTAGYLFPLSYLIDRGIDNMDSYFKGISYLGSHDAVFLAVYNGQADIGGGKDHVFDRLAIDNPDFKKSMVVLSESPEVPSNTISVKKSVDSVLVGRLRSALAGMENDPLGRKILDDFGAARFIETTAEDFKPVYSMIEKLGIDISGEELGKNKAKAVNDER